MLRSDSQSTSPEPVVNRLPEPELRPLLECLRDWLDAQRDGAQAQSLLRALAEQSIKADINSKDALLREFDSQELTAACDWPEKDDFEASKKKVKSARMNVYLESRSEQMETFFAQRGHNHALQLRRISTSGKHRGKWSLEVYPLDDGEEPEGVQLGTQPVGEASPDAPQQIKYEYSEAGTVKCSVVARPLLGRGSFKIKSLLGLLFASTLIVPALCILILAVTGWLYLFVHRPLATSDLTSIVLGKVCKTSPT